MKSVLIFAVVLLVSCGAGHTDYIKAENALDAGREFINACATGDFSKAAFFMMADEKNRTKLKETERVYREKDKEGRQQSRLASILIGEVKEINDSTTVIYYQNSFDKQPCVLEVMKQNGSWLVNFANTFNPVP